MKSGCWEVGARRVMISYPRVKPTMFTLTGQLGFVVSRTIGTAVLEKKGEVAYGPPLATPAKLTL